MMMESRDQLSRLAAQGDNRLRGGICQCYTLFTADCVRLPQMRLPRLSRTSYHAIRWISQN